MRLIYKHNMFFILFCLLLKVSSGQVNTIPGLVFWVTGDSVRISSGNSIDKCFDLSSSNNHPTQITTTMQPTSNSVGLNGHKTIMFDGNDDYLVFNEIADIRTVFWVEKENNIPGPNLSPLLGHSSAYDFHRGAGTLPWTSGFTSNDIINGVFKVNFQQVNGLTTPLNYKQTIMSLVTTNNVRANNFSNDRLAYGRVWSGELAELIIYNQALNPSQVNQVETYLHDKYTPKLDLGIDIPISQIQGCIPSNSITIQANPDFQSYLWSNGATTNQINVNQYGEYSVICSDIFGINHYDTIKVIPTPKNFNYPFSVLCGNNSITWNTQLNKIAHVFNWQDSSTDSLFVINSPGQYYVTITDTFGCAYISNTVTVTQDNFPTTASLGPDVSLCSCNLITLTSGLAPSLTYTWSDGSHSNSLVINTTGQYSVVVTNTNSCVAKDTINVTIVGQAPIANFSQSIGCKNTAVSFTNLSSAPISNTITSTLWDFGDPVSATNTSTLSNPFHTFSDTGNYIVKLKVITNVGCKQTISKTIHIAQTPTVNFSNGISCRNDSTQFTSLAIAPSYSISNCLWSFGDISSGSANSTSIKNPKHLFSNQTSYTIKLVATNNAGCKDSISKVIIVKAQVKAMFSYSAACTNAVVRFQDNSIVPAPASSNVRNWSFGVSTTSTLVSQYYPLAGTYPVTLTVIGTNGCVSYAVKQVTVTLPPVCNFVTPQNFCINDSIKLVDASTSGASSIQNWKWTVNTIPYSTLQSPYLNVTDTANHLIKLRVIDGLGCKDSISKNVYVYPIPIVDFTSSPNFIFSQTSATLTPTILNGLAYSWSGTNSFSSSLTTPIYQFADTGSYQITLLLTNNRGCKNSKTKTFIVYNKRTDLAILDIVPNIQSDGYLDLTANLANFGTTTITDFKITYKLTNGGQIKENWSGVLNAGIFYNYHFSGSALVNEADKNSIVCVTISQVNGGIDDNTKNDNLCLALFVKDIDIFSPYPNPTNHDVVFPIVLKKETNIVFDITNALGSSVLVNNSVVGSPGLNLIPLSVSNLASGCYIVKITINDKLFIKKIIKY